MKGAGRSLAVPSSHTAVHAHRIRRFPFFCSSSWPPEAPAVRRSLLQKHGMIGVAVTPSPGWAAAEIARRKTARHFGREDKILDGKYAETHDLKGPGTRQVLRCCFLSNLTVHRLAAARPAENLAQHGAAVKWIFFYNGIYEVLLFFLPGSRQGRLKGAREKYLEANSAFDAKRHSHAQNAIACLPRTTCRLCIFCAGFPGEMELFAIFVFRAVSLCRPVLHNTVFPDLPPRKSGIFSAMMSIMR